jgi:hypothetical protein
MIGQSQVTRICKPWPRGRPGRLALHGRRPQARNQSYALPLSLALLRNGTVFAALGLFRNKLPNEAEPGGLLVSDSDNFCHRTPAL